MAISHSDYLWIRSTGLNTVVVLPAVWVRLHSNNTGTDYFSTAVTTADGQFTHSAPPDDYALFYGNAATVPGTPTQANGHYSVPVTAGDDIAMKSGTSSASSPYVSSAVAGGADFSAAVHFKSGPWIDVTHPSYGADPTGVADSSPAIQAAFNAVPSTGGIVYLPAGTFKLMSTVTISKSSTQVFTAGAATKLLAGTTNIKLLYAQNLSYLWIGDIFLDGQWQAGTSGIYFDGVLNSRLGIIWADRMLGDTTDNAALVLRSTGAATQNCARNVVVALMVLNCGRAIIFNGNSTFPAANNSFLYVEANNPVGSGVASILIDLQSYCDNNTFFFVDLAVNVTASTCITYNSGIPGSNNGVYECHFLKAICSGGTVAGSSMVTVNKTERMSYMQFRSGTTNSNSPNPTINTGGLLGILPGSRSATDTDFNQLGGPVGIQLIGAASGSAPTMQPAGIDTNSNLSVQGKGNGILLLGNNLTNYVQLQPQNTGTPPILAAAGDTNLNLRLTGNGTGAIESMGDLQLDKRLIATGSAPTVGSGGTGVSALSVIAGSNNTELQVQATLTAIAPGVVVGVVQFNGNPLGSAPKAVVCSLSAPTAGVAAPPAVGADTYTTNGFTLRSYGPTTVTTGTYIITCHVFF